MSTPPVPVGQHRQVVQGDVITPTAMANRVEAAAYGLGQILKSVIGGLPSAFRTENELLAAYAAVDKFVGASVKTSAMAALQDGTEMASIEDVSQRTPPQQSAYTIPANVPVINYDLLAQAMVRAQMQIAAENAQVPETTLVNDTPAPATNTETANVEPNA